MWRFHLAIHKTNIKQEFNAGLTTFLAMLYVVPVNALLMSAAGMPADAVLTATAVLTIIACIFNGFWANTPVALSVAMGLNAYFTYGLVIAQKVPWQTALGVVFISAAIFTALSLTPFRVWIMTNIPIDLRRAISAGIGAFICLIGLKQMGIIVPSDATMVAIGNLAEPQTAIGVLGLIISLIFWALNMRAGLVLAMALTSIAAWILGVYDAPNELFSLPKSMMPIFAELDILGALKLSLVPAILTFFITHLFDSIGTLTGVCNRAEIFRSGTKDSEATKKLAKNLESDAFMSVAGSVAGLSTITAYAESASGVEAGGRTGLTAVFVGLLFVLTLFLLPLFKAIPANAIYPILVMVGVLMFSEVGKIDYKDPASSAAAFFTVILMPLTYSITIGLAAGFVVFFLIKVVRKEWEQINAAVMVLFLISLLALVMAAAPSLFSGIFK